MTIMLNLHEITKSLEKTSNYIAQGNREKAQNALLSLYSDLISINDQEMMLKEEAPHLFAMLLRIRERLADKCKHKRIYCQPQLYQYDENGMMKYIDLTYDQLSDESKAYHAERNKERDTMGCDCK